MRPQVLFLTCHLPYPPFSGGRRREYELLTRLASDLDVHLVAVSKTYREDLDAVAALQEFCTAIDLFEAVEEPPQSGLPYQVRRHVSPDATTRVHEIIRSRACNLVHVEGFYLMQHLPEPCPLPVVLVEQNVEYQLCRQRAATAPLRQRSGFVYEYLLTLEAELDAWKRSDVCAAVTTDDRDFMVAANPTLDVRLVPDGIDHLDGRPPDRSKGNGGLQESPSIVYVANFGYQPNVDGALFLLSEIFPRIAARAPRIKLFLVGNAPPPEVVDAARSWRNVVVTGRVPAVEPYIDAADIVVCPLRIGGGIKVKVLEALSRGKAIVSTTIGVQGLPGAERAMVVRDLPASFASACIRLLTNPAARQRLERRAHAFARSLPTWEHAADALRACYAEALSRPTTIAVETEVPARR